ncbi:hypothetical protein DL769_007198 [Monosporascus sp. CRB-8-3]|nr:hypothetical protein DL769_007198 [Monosporascus sp. CRB-8-3]
MANQFPFLCFAARLHNLEWGFTCSPVFLTPPDCLSIIVPLPGDIISRDNLRAVADYVRLGTGYINPLVANAGTAGPSPKGLSQRATPTDFVRCAWTTPMAEFDDVYNLNCTATYYTILAFLELLDMGNKRRLPVTPMPSTKAVVISMMKSFATRGVSWGIRFNSIAAGFFPSAMSESALVPFKVSQEKHPSDEGAFARSFLPAERARSKEDITGVLFYLASKAGELRIGWYDWVVVNSPEAFKELFDKRSISTSSKILAPIGHGVVTGGLHMFTMPYGPHWRAHRTVMHRLLASKPTLEFVPSQEFYIKQFLYRLAFDNEDQGAFFGHVRRMSFSIVTTSTYGRCIESQDHPDLSNAGEASALLGRITRPGGFIEDIPPLAMLPKFLQPSHRRAKKYADIILRGKMRSWNQLKAEIDAGIAAPSFGRDLAESDCKSQGLTDEDAAWITAGLVEAGADITAVVIQNLILYFAGTPEAQKKAHEELDRVVGNSRAPNFEDLQSLPTPAHIVTAEYATMSDPLKRDHFTFGGGRRLCPASSLAENTLDITVANMLWAFELLPPTTRGADGKEVEGSINTSDNAFQASAFRGPKPFRMRFVLRSQEQGEIVRTQWETARATGYKLRSRRTHHSTCRCPCRRRRGAVAPATLIKPQPANPARLLPADAPASARAEQVALRDALAEASLLATAATEFVPDLALRNNHFASVRWLCHFDIPSSSPWKQRTRMAPATEQATARPSSPRGLYSAVSEVARVPEHQLRSIARMAVLGADRPISKTAYAVAWQTYLPLFKHIAADPDLQARYAAYMRVMPQSEGMALGHLLEGRKAGWADLDRKGAVLVDVGGSAGHASVTLARAFPGIKAVVQDRPEVVERAQNESASRLEKQGIKLAFQAHDFFTPQPARPRGFEDEGRGDVYLLRQILHDWNDEQSITILRHMAAALEGAGRDARLVVMDTVLPLPGEGSRTEEAVLRVRDLTMQQAHNAHERSEVEWKELLRRAHPALKIKRVVQPFKSVMAVIEIAFEWR